MTMMPEMDSRELKLEIIRLDFEIGNRDEKIEGLELQVEAYAKAIDGIIFALQIGGQHPHDPRRIGRATEIALNIFEANQKHGTNDKRIEERPQCKVCFDHHDPPDCVSPNDLCKSCGTDGHCECF